MINMIILIYLVIGLLLSIWFYLDERKGLNSLETIVGILMVIIIGPILVIKEVIKLYLKKIHSLIKKES